MGSAWQLLMLLNLSLHGVAALSNQVSHPLGASFESVISGVQARVRKQYGSKMTLIEALVCREYLCFRGNGSLNTPGDATFMRAVFITGTNTAPNVEALVNITEVPPAMTLNYHTEPFVQDNNTQGFPPRSNMTFESAWAMVAARVPKTGFAEVSWRRPLHPCVSEDLFQFQFDHPFEQQGVMSVGSSSGKACFGFVTNPVYSKFCNGSEFKPQCKPLPADPPHTTMV